MPEKEKQPKQPKFISFSFPLENRGIHYPEEAVKEWQKKVELFKSSIQNVVPEGNGYTGTILVKDEDSEEYIIEWRSWPALNIPYTESSGKPGNTSWAPVTLCQKSPDHLANDAKGLEVYTAKVKCIVGKNHTAIWSAIFERCEKERLIPQQSNT